MNLQVNRIKEKFASIFQDKIDMTDMKEKEGTEEYEKAFLSRCLAAYALIIISDIDEEKAASCVTDGFKDKGIDAIFNDRNNEQLILVQAKWSNDGNGTISQGDTLKYVSGVEKILDLNYSDFNSKILNKKSEIDSAISSMNYQIKMIIIYTSNNSCPKESNDEIEKLKNRINDNLNELLISETITLTKIYGCLANTSLNQDIILEDVLINNWGSIEENERPRVYYGMIDASSVAEWWRQSGNRLLARNIRFFKGDTDVNNGIIKSLTNNPERFCYYNNGIKLVAKKVIRKLAYSSDRKTGLFRIEGASIVNGAQTTGCIGKAYDICPENVSKAKLMIQIISLEDAQEDFGENITKLSNTQNKIGNKTFVSMDPFHAQIAIDLRMDGIEYTYKEGDLRTGNNICNVDEAAIALGCFLGDISLVTTIKREVGSIFDDINRSPYKLIFNNSVSSFLLWNAIRISRSFDQFNIEYQNSHTGVEKLISVHGNRFLLYLLYNELKKQKIDLQTGYVDVEKITICEIVLQYIEKIKAAKEYLYPDAYPANIFKSVNRCKKIKDYIIDAES